MRSLLLLVTALIASMALSAQSLSNVQFQHMQKPEVRREILIPDIMGYKTLKCDFHMHTIFSDGIVWPTFRVEEAWQEGLDAIAITDHIENQPSKPFVSGNKNSSYEIAAPYAEEKNIILIRAGEITRRMPPGHLNAIFLKDVNLIDVEFPEDALQEAKRQGAFIMWNHPGWKAQQPDTCKWMPMHQEFYEKGLIHGIEVFNEKEYYPIVLDWCLEKNLSVIGNSDIHDVTGRFYDLENGYRPVTLVFAKDRSSESIREALFDKRTVAWFDGKLAGKETFLKAIFEASVTIVPTGKSDSKKNPYYEVKNKSAIPYIIQPQNGGDAIILHPLSSVITSLDRNTYSKIRIINLYTGSRSVLETTLTF